MTELERHLIELGIIAKPTAPAVPACYAPPQWKPSYPGEQPPF
ncbi:hypothetical protein [Caudoviricetes sp.]|nr:hypothetical protein [Caudoviricetes sp.]